MFDGHAILRLALLFTCVVFAGLIPEIISFSGSVFFVVNYILAIGILLYLALFHKFPVSANIRKLRNDVDIPEVTSVEPSRDFQKDLIEKDEMLQMMVDASSDGFWTFDVPTGKVYWSNRVAKLLGIDPDQVDDTFETLKRCVIESDWEVFRKEMTKSLNENRPFNLSLRLVSASDSPKELTVSGRPQFNEEGRPIRLIGFLGERMSTAAMERQKYYYAYQDALTGVYNRKFFLEKLKVDIDNAAKRPDYMFAVALLDIDSFGAINDSFSTNFGDNVLRVVADRIKGSCRDNDCVARIGPDVFAVVLHNIQGADPDDDLMPIVRRLHNKVKAPVNL